MPKRRQWRGSEVIIFNWENNSHLFLEFVFVTLNKEISTIEAFLEIFWKRQMFHSDIRNILD